LRSASSIFWVRGRSRVPLCGIFGRNQLFDLGMTSAHFAFGIFRDFRSWSMVCPQSKIVRSDGIAALRNSKNCQLAIWYKPFVSGEGEALCSREEVALRKPCTDTGMLFRRCTRISTVFEISCPYCVTLFGRIDFAEYDGQRRARLHLYVEFSLSISPL
jgi:hypothetical protein